MPAEEEKESPDYKQTAMQELDGKAQV